MHNQFNQDFNIMMSPPAGPYDQHAAPVLVESELAPRWKMWWRLDETMGVTEYNDYTWLTEIRVPEHRKIHFIISFGNPDAPVGTYQLQIKAHLDAIPGQPMPMVYDYRLSFDLPQQADVTDSE
ncbi:unnamed protein product, partial [Mesorhabditis belari]|uniref:Uncharacterized protein n=1 Tax=Mesorhabditis belari TaxID=2138241 RepID=A0AAF3F2T1_9BILA